MNDIAARQIICLRYFRVPDRFMKSLFVHDVCTFSAKLNARIGVNGIVNTAVTGNKTAQQSAVTLFYILGS